MAKSSAGLLVCRIGPVGPELLLAHPGGPFWARRDAGSWSVPKGEYGRSEDPETAARREFLEETGHAPPAGPFVDLGEIRQKAGKIVRAYAVRGDFDPASLRSNTVEIEWPPRSGRRLVVPEIDRVAWFGPAEAARSIMEAQRPFVDRALAAFAPDVVSLAP